MRIKNLIKSKFNIAGIYRTWFLKCLGVIYIFFTLLAFVSIVYFRNGLYKNVKNIFKVDCTNASRMVDFQAKINKNYDFITPNFIKELQSENKNERYVVVLFFGNSGKIICAENREDFCVEEISQDVCARAENKVMTKKIGDGRFFITSMRVLDVSGSSIGHLVLLERVDYLRAVSVRIGLLIFCILVVIIIFLYLVSKYFIKNIIAPIGEVSKMARRIALGDLKTRILKKDNDELGELCDTINYMAQKLSESERMKNDFISSVSHELRTPLTAIKGWAETIVLDNLIDEEDVKMNKKGIEIIVHESERLCTIVEELLDFSKLQSGRIILNLEKIDILAELSEAVYIFVKRAKNEGKILLYSEPDSLPPVLGDKNRLKQVFINVIDNALKYTKDKGVVNVGARVDGNFVKVEISDNGEGISKSDLPKVKNKFYKGNSNKGGSGIGLALANELVLLHSGHLEIKSEENIGTVVSIYLPKISKN